MFSFLSWSLYNSPNDLQCTEIRWPGLKFEIKLRGIKKSGISCSGRDLTGKQDRRPKRILLVVRKWEPSKPSSHRLEWRKWYPNLCTVTDKLVSVLSIKSPPVHWVSPVTLDRLPERRVRFKPRQSPVGVNPYPLARTDLYLTLSFISIDFSLNGDLKSQLTRLYKRKNRIQTKYKNYKHKFSFSTLMKFRNIKYQKFRALTYHGLPV